MECHECAADNPTGHRFCAGCGTALRTLCAHCGFLSLATASFCGGCGSSLGGPHPGGLPKDRVEQILRSRSSIEGERKQVTVLFADMKDSLELIAEHDVEHSQAVLDRAVQMMTEAVHRFGGTVNQVLGDGVMALFGAPLAQEDHALLACHAAVAIQEDFRSANEDEPERFGAEVQVRIGLNSGEVVVRAVHNDLTMDYRAIGPTTHLAARMEQTAQPGCIHLTQATLRQAEGFLETTPLGPLDVKGMRDPVEVHRLDGVNATRSRFRAAFARGLTRFAGRQDELRTLEIHLRAARDEHGSLVLVSGAAGVGKSRLIHEFLQGDAARDWLRLEAGASAYTRNTPYLPLIDLLRSWLDVTSSEPPDAVGARLLGELERLDLHRGWAPVALASLLDLPVESRAWRRFDPAQRRRAVLDATLDLLLALAREHPTLVVFEDLHWTDAETLALIDELARGVSGVRVLIVASHRPEYHPPRRAEGFPPGIELGSLPERAARQMLEDLLGSSDGLDGIKARLLAHSNGIPFYLEESVRSLVERGVLSGERGAYRAAGELASLEIPTTVQAVLADRIDRLAPEPKRILQVASVIGNAAPVSLIASVARLSEKETCLYLQELEQADFLYETRRPPDAEYTFSHNLTRDVAYESLLLERRRALHAQVLTAVEQRFAERIDEWVPRLADHAFRGAVWPKAVLYHVKACIRAVAQSANSDAVAIFERGLRALEELPAGRQTTEAGIDLRLIVQSAFILLGEHEQLVERLNEAEEMSAAIDDPHRLSATSAFLAVALWMAGRHEDALRTSEQGLAIARTHGDERQENALRFTVGIVHHALGHYEQSIALHRALLKQLGQDEPRLRGWVAYPIVFVHTFLAAAHVQRGEWKELRHHTDEGCRIADELGHPYSQVMIYDYKGYLHLELGEVGAAIEALEKAWDVCNGYEVLTMRPAIAARLGSAYTRAGRVDDALAVLEPTADPDVYQRGGQYTWLWLFLSLAETYRAAGRTDDAIAYAERGLALSSANGERPHQAMALRILGELHGDGGPEGAAEAERCFREARELASQCGMRPLQSDAGVGLAELLVRDGRCDEAQALLEEAARAYGELELPQRQDRVAAALADARRRPS